MQSVLDFVDAGHDLILTADASASDLIRSIAKQCGVNFDEVCVKFGNLVRLGKLENKIIAEFVLIWCRIRRLWLLITPITRCWRPKETIL